MYDICGVDTIHAVPSGHSREQRLLGERGAPVLPLVDVIATSVPDDERQGIRGRAYFDFGGAWFDGQSTRWTTSSAFPRTASPSPASPRR